MRKGSAILILSLLLVACTNATTTTPFPTLIPSTLAPTAPPIVPTATRIPSTPTPLSPTPSPVPPTPTPVPPTAEPAGASPAPAPPLDELPDETRAGWAQFVASLEGDDPARAQTRANTFWDAVVKKRRVPLLLNDTAIFLYKGQASSVTWRGDFSFWELGTGLEGTRIRNTDLWYALANFPRDSRTDYQIVVNHSQWILDAANPHQRGSWSGNVSVLTMPDFRVTEFTARRADVPRGTLTDWTALDSAAWGAPINYRVYTPPQYDTLAQLPVLYVTDGNDFSKEREGAMPVVLDNLIADEKITPVMAVFIDARNAKNPSDNQRETQLIQRSEAFAKFITSELIPIIDAQYHTHATREGRVLVGTSYGGVFSIFAGLEYPDVFGNLALFSPAYWVLDSPAGRMSQFVRDALSKKSSTPTKIFMSGGIPDWDVGKLEPRAKLFRDRGDAIQLFHSQEGHSWGAWSGLMDEMLEYFFAN